MGLRNREMEEAAAPRRRRNRCSDAPNRPRVWTGVEIDGRAHATLPPRADIPIRSREIPVVDFLIPAPNKEYGYHPALRAPYGMKNRGAAICHFEGGAALDLPLAESPGAD